MTRVEIPPEGPDDPGHLLPADEWAQVVSGAHTHARLAAQTTTRAAALTVLNLPAKFHGGAQTPTVQVVHDAETPISDGYAKSIGQFFQRGPAAGTSAHRMIGPSTVVRMLGLDVVGYHCGPAGNRGTAGYEQCGYARFSRADWTTADGLAQLETLAAELARDAQLWGIPDRHITDAQLRAWAAAGRPASLGGRCTHDQIHRVLGGTSHTDPTPNYPLDLLNAAVTRHRNPAPAPAPQEDWFAMADKDDLKDAIREVFHLPAGGVAIPAGKANNAGMYADVLNLARTNFNAQAALAGAVAAVKADTALQGDDEAKVLAKLAEIEIMLPAPAPAPEA
jgi:hypothetical protein